MIIGIGGVSRAGKTTLARVLEDKLKKSGRTVDVFCLDDFVKPRVSLQLVQGFPDWERPNSVKWDTLTRALEKSEAHVKIVEGLFTFYPASLRSEFDLKIFLEIDRPTFQKRRSEDNRWDEEPEWYPDHVWRSYQKYGMMKGEKSEYLQLDGNAEFDLDLILSRLAVV